jgi:hypothetical protein
VWEVSLSVDMTTVISGWGIRKYRFRQTSPRSVTELLRESPDFWTGCVSVFGRVGE